MGSQKTPGGPLIAYFKQKITSYILYTALKLFLKGSWSKENLLWHPFDDLRVLNDPNDSEKGL